MAWTVLNNHWNDVSDGVIQVQHPSRSLTTLVDSNSLVSSAAVVGHETQLTMQADTTVSRLLNLGAYYSTSVLDYLGRNSSINVDLHDLCRLTLWTSDDDPPSADLIIWAALTAGALSSTSMGVGVALEASGTDWKVSHATNAGAGWNFVSGTAVSADTVGAGLQLMLANAQNTARTAAYGLNSAGNPITTTNVSTAPSTNNVGNDFDTISWGAGWITGDGSGTVGAVAKLGVHCVLIKADELPGMARE